MNMYVIMYKDLKLNKFYRSRVRASDELRAMEVLRETINHPIEIEWVKDWTPKKPQ